MRHRYKAMKWLLSIGVTLGKLSIGITAFADSSSAPYFHQFEQPSSPSASVSSSVYQEVYNAVYGSAYDPTSGGSDTLDFVPPKGSVSDATSHAMGANYGSAPMPSLNRTRQELIALRTDNSQTFVNPDGSFTTSIYPTPVFYQGVGKHWNTIKNDLMKSLDPNYDFQSMANNYTVYFTTRGDHAGKIHFAKGLDFFDFWPVSGAKGRSANPKHFVADFHSWGAKRTRVGFHNWLPSTDLQYRVTATGLTEDIVLASPLSPDQFSFTLQTGGVTPIAESDGSIELVDKKTGAVTATIPAPFMYDAKGARSSAVVQDLSENHDGSYTLTVTPDATWLASTDRIFPVTIDPSINSSTSTTMLATGIAGAPDDAQNYATNSIATVGEGGTGVAHSVLIEQPDLPVLVEGASAASITSATLTITHPSYESSGYSVSASLLTSPWQSSAVTWDSRPQEGTNFASQVSDNGQIDITQAVKDWYSGTSNYGIELDATANDPTNVSTSIETGQAGTNAPVLTINYTVNPIGNTGPWTSTGDGVSVADGGLSLSQLDFSTPVRGTRMINIMRTYNSLNDASGSLPGHINRFGNGWASVLDMSIKDPGNFSGPVVFTDGQGKQHIFVPVLNAANPSVHLYTTDSADPLWLQETSNGDVVTTQYGTALQFNLSGQLTSISTPTTSAQNANVTLIEYTNGQISSLIDPSGRTWTIQTNANGAISSITDPAGRVAVYSYDGSSNLVSVAFNAQSGSSDTTTVGYGYNTAGQLSSVTDPSGHTTSYQYTGSQVTQVSYPITVSGTRQTGTHLYAYHGSVTWYTDADGHVTLYDLGVDGLVTDVHQGAQASFQTATVQVGSSTNPTQNGSVSTPSIVGQPLVSSDNNGQISNVTVSGGTVAFQVSGGNPTGTTQIPGNSKSVSGFLGPQSSNSFPSTYSYSDSQNYSGTLSTSGSAVAASESIGPQVSNSFPSTDSYGPNGQGFYGNLPTNGSSTSGAVLTGSKSASASIGPQPSNQFPTSYGYSDNQGYSGTLPENGQPVPGSYLTGTKSVSNSITNTTASFPSTNSYSDSSGYNGTLSQSGSPTTSAVPGATKSVSSYFGGEYSSSCPSSYSYSDSQGYSGVLSLQSCSSVESSTWGTHYSTNSVPSFPSTYYYSYNGYTGTISMYGGASNMGGYWRQEYAGTVYKVTGYDAYYSGTVQQPTSYFYTQNYSGTAYQYTEEYTQNYSGTVTQYTTEYTQNYLGYFQAYSGTASQPSTTENLYSYYVSVQYTAATGLNLVSSYQWTQDHQLEKVTDPNGQTSSYSYYNVASGAHPGVNVLSQMSDALNNTTTLDYSSTNQLQGVQSPAVTSGSSYGPGSYLPSDSVDAEQSIYMTDIAPQGVVTKASVPVTVGDNLAPNATFDFATSGLPTDWPTVVLNGSGTVGLLAQGAKYSSQALELTAGSGTGYVGDTTNSISVNPGESYYVTAWVKPSGVQTGSAAAPAQGAEMIVNWGGGGTSTVGSVVGTSPWTRISGLIQAPTGATSATLTAALYGNTGTALFDLVQLVPVNEKFAQNVLANANLDGQPAGAAEPYYWNTDANSQLDPGTTHSGEPSIELDGQSGQTQVSQQVMAPAGPYSGVEFWGSTKSDFTSFGGTWSLSIVANYQNGPSSAPQTVTLSPNATETWQNVSDAVALTAVNGPGAPVSYTLTATLAGAPSTDHVWFNDFGLSFIGAGSTTAGVDNLLANPDFDGGLSDWLAPQGSGAAAVQTLTSATSPADFHNGRSALVMTPTTTGPESLSSADAIPVGGTGAFALLGYIHTLNLAGDDAYLELDALDASKNVIGTFASQKVGKTSTNAYGAVPWTRVDVEVAQASLPAGTVYVRPTLVTASDANGSAAQVSFSDLLLLPYNPFSTITYDTNMNYATSVTDSLGNTAQASYSGSDNASGQFSANFTGTNTGDPTSLTDADHNTTSYSYNKADQIVSYTFPVGSGSSVTHETFTYAYDANGNLVTVTPPGSAPPITYTYNELGEVTSRTETVASTTQTKQWAYDAEGLLTSVTEPGGYTRTYTYDAANRLTGVTRSNGTTQDAFSYGYDPAGNVTSAQGGAASYTFAYNGIHQMISGTDGTGDSQQYTLDPAGRPTSMGYTLAGGRGSWTETDAYDSAGALLSVGNGLDTVQYQYEPGGAVASAYDVNSHVTTYNTYGPTGLPTETRTVGPDGTLLVDNAYTYDANGNVTSVTNELTGVTRSYAYDSQGQLTQETLPSGVTLSYTYDDLGNRTSTTASSGSVPTGSAKTYTWNAEHRLASVTVGATTYSYTYDALGRLRTYTDGTNTYDLGYTGPTDEVAYVTDSSGTLLKRFTYDSMGNPALMSFAVSGTWYTYGYLYDGLGTIIGLVDDTPGSAKLGQQVVSYAYDAWGNPLSAPTDTSTTGAAGENPFVYKGYWYDGGAGLYNLNARFYDPTTGKFLSQDPIDVAVGDALSYNAYDYAGNNPVNNVDPSGMDEYTNPQMQGLIDTMAAEGAAEENLAENAAQEAGAVPGMAPVGESADPVAKPSPEGAGDVIKVSNMSDFFKNTSLGKSISKSLQKTNYQYQGQSIFRVTQKVDNPYLKKGDGVYLDALHKDHLEVVDGRGNMKAVLNLDGSLNVDKTKAALGRTVNWN